MEELLIGFWHTGWQKACWLEGWLVVAGIGWDGGWEEAPVFSNQFEQDMQTFVSGHLFLDTYAWAFHDSMDARNAKLDAKFERLATTAL